MIEFAPHHFWFLFLILLLPVFIWRFWAMRRKQGLVYSTVAHARMLTPTLRMRLRWIPPLLRVLVLALLIFCLARPRDGHRENKVVAEGIAIQLAIDRSNSMQALDFKLNGQTVNRLTAVKHVAADFVTGEHTDGSTARESDMIGVITFGTYADNLSPMTLDHQHVARTLLDIDFAQHNDDVMTSIGDALGLAVERLNAMERRREQDGQEPLKSKVVILLTDGFDTRSQLEPLRAAELAKAAGVKVYTIGVGSDQPVPYPTVGRFGEQTIRYAPFKFDEELLREMSSVTGGAFFKAEDTGTLTQIYEAIDQLEKSKLENKQYVDYQELAVDAVDLGPVTLPPLLLFAFALLALELGLSATVFKRMA